MSACQQLAANASAGVAPALRAVDCLASETTAAAFGRLLGGNGALVPALTILLTLYIAFFAISLLTGRSRLGIAALTPRMVTIGLVLTFSTSWIAYQSVVWNLAIGAPDQIATVLTGSTGSATQIFADRIDMVFAAIAEAATDTGQTAQDAGAAVTSGSFSPTNITWLAALLLMLGTVGIMVTARIALAVLLAVGPVFVVFALFPGTRGLTAGWLRGIVMTAVTPLYVVVGGGIVMELLVPIVAALRSSEGAIDGRAAMALFLVAVVHLALMSLIGKVTATTVSAWTMFGLGAGNTRQQSAAASDLAAASITAAAQAAASAPPPAALYRRSAMAGAMLPTIDGLAGAAGTPAEGSRPSRTVIVQGGARNHAALPPAPGRRARGIGSRFQPAKAKGMIR